MKAVENPFQFRKDRKRSNSFKFSLIKGIKILGSNIYAFSHILLADQCVRIVVRHSLNSQRKETVIVKLILDFFLITTLGPCFFTSLKIFPANPRLNCEIGTIFSIALSTDDIKPAPFTTVEFHINIKNDVFISKLIDKLAIRLKQSSVLSNIIDDYRDIAP